MKLAIEKKFNLQARELAKRLIKTEELKDIREFIATEPRVVEVFLELNDDNRI